MAKKEDDKFRFATPQHTPIDSPDAPDGGANGRKIVEKIKKQGHKIPELDTHAVYVSRDGTFLERLRGKNQILEPVERDTALEGLNAEQAKNRASLVKLEKLLQPVVDAVEPLVVDYEKAVSVTLASRFSDRAKAAAFAKDEPKVYEMARKQMKFELSQQKDEPYAHLETMGKKHAQLKSVLEAAKQLLAGDPSAMPDQKRFNNTVRHIEELGAEVRVFAATANKDPEKLPKFVKPHTNNILKANSLLTAEKKSPSITPTDIANIKYYAHEGSWEMRAMLQKENAAVRGGPGS